MDGPVSGTHAEEAFGAKVYKISRDSQGSRLTHMKITNGVLKVKEILEYMAEEEPLQEKVNQIRIYSGDKYEMVQEAEKGCICAVTGLTRTYPGQGLGMQQSSSAPVLEPVLELPRSCRKAVMSPDAAEFQTTGGRRSDAPCSLEMKRQERFRSS